MSTSLTPRPSVAADPPAGRAPGSRRAVVIRTVVTVVAVAVLMFPMYWMLRTSVAPTDEFSDLPVSLWPENWRFGNYVDPWNRYPFARWVINSTVIAVVSVLLTLGVNLSAGYAFAKLRFPMRNVLFLLIISTLMVPVQVIMIPQFQIVIDLHLINSTWGVILPRLAEAFGLFMARQFFVSIPDELLEAARVDGVGHLRTFWHIVLPLSKPLIAALIIFTFMWRWNEFVWPLIVLNDGDSYTLPVGLRFLISQFGTDYGPLLAMSFLSIVPMLVVFAFFQRYFVEGIARTGLK